MKISFATQSKSRRCSAVFCLLDFLFTKTKQAAPVESAQLVTYEYHHLLDLLSFLSVFFFLNCLHIPLVNQ
jgi:hypothetical protein